MRVLTPLFLAALLVGGCSPQAASPSVTTSTPISANVARNTALREGAGTGVTVVSVELSTYGAKANGGAVTDPNTLVWAVRLSGTFAPPSCGGYTPTPHPCPSSPATSELILIDARTGAFIQGEVPAPSAGWD